ncbi:hypothetical protein FHX42_003005 [Saccharopolyspora lacisalsi]|uniref:LppM domain-containing protein n=1 Tax=Halosaccharopolyspora lacisalsi TaxID=1000566 RepID=A0A839DY29_9PSEU|nr:DUF3153 domain-containing protein [Halosaccharopolyspora lacisalsi]MBA8825639.1 hypothetical protein [Halosaccharopolyspora lacisalsi]
MRVTKDRHRSGAALVLLVMLGSLLLSGCLRANVSMTFSENDRVSGEVLVAVRRPANQEPFRLRVPREFRERVHTTPYSENGRVGSTLSFDNLTFGEAEQLGRALGGSNSRYDFSIKRAGSLIEVHGSVDLTPLDQTNSSVVVRINTVGEVTTTNGKNSSGTITWRPQPGEVTELSATFQHSDSGGGTWLNWTLMIGALTLGVAALVAKLALDNHRRTHGDAESVA